MSILIQYSPRLPSPPYTKHGADLSPDTFTTMATSSTQSSLYDAGIEKPPLSTSLTVLADRLKTQAVDEALKYMANLAPDIEATTTLSGVLSLSHPAYSGTTSLDDLARTYLNIGRKISNSEDLSLPTRLRWADLHKFFEK